MLTTILALTSVTAPAVLPSKVISASLFKNGYALVIRQVSVKESGTYAIDDFGQGVLGTVWLSASSGVSLKSVTALTRPSSVTNTTKETAKSSADLIRFNEGKAVELTMDSGSPISGTIGKVLGDSFTVHQGKKVVLVSLASVKRVSAPNGLIYERTVTTKTPSAQRSLMIETTGGGQVTIAALERGLTWSPSYSLELGSDGSLTLDSKAIVLNDLASISGAEVKLVTGFPNIEHLNKYDPLTTAMDVNTFLSVLGQSDAPFLGGQMANQAAFGGFGGGGGGRGPGGPAPVGIPGSGEAAEDLFFYTQPGVKLERGQRGYYSVARVRIPFSRQYVWDVALKGNIEGAGPTEPEDVWSAVKFKNTTGMPLTTAPASTYLRGQLIGQSTLKYTPKDDEVEVRLTKALDVRPEAVEEEMDRQRGALNLYGQVFDLVTVKGTLQVQNLKAETIDLRIQKSLIGEVVSSAGATSVSKTTRSLRDVNGGATLRWNIKVESGKTQELIYTYRAYVRV